jgi:hypothetical protein
LAQRARADRARRRRRVMAKVESFMGWLAKT